MTQTAVITEAITTLQDAENRFSFVRVEDEEFFSEWYEGLSEITEAEKASVDVVRRRYLYHRAGGDLLEGTVILLLVSPILALSGFYEPPFRIKAESSVELVLDDGEEILRGQIDVLVLQEQFWVIVLSAQVPEPSEVLGILALGVIGLVTRIKRLPSVQKPENPLSPCRLYDKSLSGHDITLFCHFGRNQLLKDFQGFNLQVLATNFSSC
ncbi:MAG: PEP-CTERM sorting domain-containing protein [Nostoc sp.]|uniref:PEP-CTERM sorting domain-containing protein n=1 Tax=Nostoc sp. TaxID=1180 RepID=UPI002FF547D4